MISLHQMVLVTLVSCLSSWTLTPVLRAEDVQLGSQPSAQQRWAALPTAEKDRIRQNYRRYQQMPETERRGLRDRFRRFQLLSPGERLKVLENHRRFRQLSPERQAAIKAKYQRFMQLPASERSKRLQLLRQRRMERRKVRGAETPKLERFRELHRRR